MELGFSRIADLLLGSKPKAKPKDKEPQQDFMAALRQQFQKSSENLIEVPGMPKGVYSYGAFLPDNAGGPSHSSFIV